MGNLSNCFMCVCVCLNFWPHGVTYRFLVPWPGIETVPCAVEVRSLNHWTAKAGNMIPGLGRSPGEGNINPLQYSWLGNPPDRRAWQATVRRVTRESDTTEQLNNSVYHCRSPGTGSSHFSSVQTLMQAQSRNFTPRHSASPLLPAPRLPCGHCSEVHSMSRPTLVQPRRTEELNSRVGDLMPFGESLWSRKDESHR